MNPNSFYKLNIILLSIVGQWPEQSKRSRLPRVIIFNIIVLLALISQFAEIIRTRHDKEMVMDIFPIFTVIAVIFALSCILNFHFETLKDLWKRIYEDWAAERNEVENKFKEEYAEVGKIISKLITLLMCISVSILIPVTFFLPDILDIISPLNESRPIQLFVHGYAFVDQEKHISEMLIFTYIVMIAVTIFGVANTTMFCVLLQHICGMLAILCHRLEYPIPTDVDKLEKKSIFSLDTVYRNSLILCIERHQKVTEFAALLEKYYAPCVSTIILAVTLALSPTLYQLADFSLENYKAVLQAIIILVFFFIINFMGQRLINMSTEIPKKAYSGPWYRCSTQTQSLLVLMIRKSIKPCSLTAYGFFELSLDCFRMIVQAGMSYFMVLREV